MESKAQPSFKFHDLAKDAGLGSLVWGQSSYLAAKYYHDIVAAFTTLILYLILSRHAPRWVLVASVLGYLIYFGLRKCMPAQLERQFYRPGMQFIRAFLGWLLITALLIFTPDGEQTALWVLYLLIILLTSKHCSTTLMAIVGALSCLGLVVVRLTHHMLPLDVLRDSDMWAECLLLGLMSFILHYLVRNIQARDETIAAYNAVNDLARDVDMADASKPNEWLPTLMALLKHLGGACASVWMCDRKTRRLQLVNARRNGQSPEGSDLNRQSVNNSIPLDSPALIAAVARTGQAAHCATPSPSASGLASCLKCDPTCFEACAELAVPINIGTNEHQDVIGVLSVGFNPKSFQERLLNDYENFMRGMVSQAKAVLAYAQRLDELIELQKASRQVWRSFDLEQVLDSILHALVEQLGFEFAVISLVDDDRRIIRSVQGLNVPQKWLEAAVHSLDCNDIQADIVRTGRTVVLKDWDDRFDRGIWTEFNHKDLVRVFMPIEVVDAQTRQERVIGTIEAGYHLSNRAEIPADQLRMLETFGDQVGMAIEHARLLQHVKNKANILASLHRVGQVIASAGQPAQVLQEIARSAKALLDADIVMLYPYSYRGNTPTVDLPVICGEIRKPYRLNLDLNEENILTRLLRDIHPYYSPDAQRDASLTFQSGEAAKGKVTFIQRHNIKSFAGIPLVADGETVGVMFVNYRKRRQFDPDDRQVHELFAQQAAVTIKNAESNELAHDQIAHDERYHLSRELHHSVSQALFGIVLKAQNAMARVPPDSAEVRAELKNIFEIAHEASNETGFIIEELHAPIEAGRYQIRGLQEYAERIRRWYGLEIVFKQDIRQPLALEQEQVMVRFAREAINNAIRHAHCHTIVTCCESSGDHISICVQDDGVGFDLSQAPPGKRGLKNMQELANSVGGICDIQTSLGAGTKACLRIQGEGDTEEE